MTTLALTPRQLDVAHAPPARRIYAAGVAGTGKTTAAVARLRHLLDAGVPPDDIETWLAAHPELRQLDVRIEVVGIRAGRLRRVPG